LQVAGVAKPRHMPQIRIRELVNEHGEGRMLGLLGEPRVNVLNLTGRSTAWRRLSSRWPRPATTMKTIANGGTARRSRATSFA